MGDKQLTIGISAYSAISLPTFVSFLGAMPFPCTTRLSIQRSCYVHQNREEIFREAIKAEATHLLFIDSDMEFPADAIKRLMERDKEIIGVNYHKRQTPPISTVKLAGGELAGSVIPDDLFRCAAVGAGFMCIKMGPVLEKMRPPYFEIGRTESGEMVGEDVYFCRKATAAGLEVWCDPTIAVGHIGEYRY